MTRLGISRRTLQRWMDDIGIDPLSFDGHKRLFLTRIHVIQLDAYSKIMASNDLVLITRYREAVQEGDWSTVRKLRKHADD